MVASAVVVIGVVKGGCCVEVTGTASGTVLMAVGAGAADVAATVMFTAAAVVVTAPVVVVTVILEVVVVVAVILVVVVVVTVTVVVLTDWHRLPSNPLRHSHPHTPGRTLAPLIACPPFSQGRPPSPA